MLTGTLTQSLFTSTNIIADVNTSEKSSTELVATKTKNHNEPVAKVGYYLYSSDMPIFEENTATKIDMLLLDNPNVTQ